MLTGHLCFATAFLLVWFDTIQAVPWDEMGRALSRSSGESSGRNSHPDIPKIVDAVKRELLPYAMRLKNELTPQYVHKAIALIDPKKSQSPNIPMWRAMKDADSEEETEDLERTKHSRSKRRISNLKLNRSLYSVQSSNDPTYYH